MPWIHRLSPVRFFLWFISIVFGALVAVVLVDPIQGFFKNSAFVQERSTLVWGALNDPWAYVPLAAVFAGGVASAAWAFRLLGWLHDSRRGYADTRLRIKHVVGQTDAYLEDFQANIFDWRQERVAINPVDPKGNPVGPQITFFYFTILFEREVQHERMLINTYGHPAPSMSVSPMGGRGVTIQFHADVTMPVIEFFFPPLGYHAQEQKAKHAGEI